MSMSLWTDLRDIERLQSRIERLGKFNRTDLLNAIGAEVESQTRRRLSTEKTSPDGEAWQELTDDYAAKKSAVSSGGLLEFKADLIESTQYLLMSDAVIVGSNKPYARRHNLGDEHMPQRQFLGLSNDNINDLSNLLDDFLDSHIERAFA